MSSSHAGSVATVDDGARGASPRRVSTSAARLADSLRVRLLVALVVPLAGCKQKAAPTGAAATVKPATTWVDTTPRDPEDPLASPIRKGGCPGGDVCAPASMLAAFATSATQSLGCPSVLAGDKLADAGAPTGSRQSRVTLDPFATQERRDAGDASTCCYRWSQPCTGGRPLVYRGRSLVATPSASRDWS